MSNPFPLVSSWPMPGMLSARTCRTIRCSTRKHGNAPQPRLRGVAVDSDQSDQAEATDAGEAAEGALTGDGALIGEGALAGES